MVLGKTHMLSENNTFYALEKPFKRLETGLVIGKTLLDISG